jgi:hypothetical protein
MIQHVFFSDLFWKFRPEVVKSCQVVSSRQVVAIWGHDPNLHRGNQRGSRPSCIPQTAWHFRGRPHHRTAPPGAAAHLEISVKSMDIYGYL